MANQIVHWELMGADGAALAAFYKDIFDWDPQPLEGFGEYHIVADADTGIGGAVGQGPEGMPSYFAMYIGVDSIDDHLAKITAAGGTTVVPRTVIPGTVTFAMFADPAGNVVGLTENETPPAE